MDDVIAGVVLALDLGGTRIRAAEVDADGSAHGRLSVPTPVAEGPDAIVAACADVVGRVRAAADPDARTGGPLLGVGISAPGPVDPSSGVVVDPPNLGTGFHDVRLAARVAASVGLPAFLDRDTQVAALAEGTFGAARGCADFVYVTVSTGIGGAVVSGGRPLRGPDGSAGEVGHLLVDRAGPPCGCGARGHLEAIASGAAIARSARSAVERGALTSLAAIAAAAGPAFGAREVVAAAGRGDAVAVAIIDDACDAFAASCVSLVDLFNPELIVVGGGLARGLGERLLAPARDAVARLAFRTPARRVRIVPAALGDDVGLVGAGVLVRERLAASGASAASGTTAARGATASAAGTTR